MRTAQVPAVVSQVPTSVTVEAQAAEAVAAAVELGNRVDDETVVRMRSDRILSSTRSSYGDQMPRLRNFFRLRRQWSWKAVHSEHIWMENVGPPPRYEVWNRLRIRELIILMAWLLEGEKLRHSQVSTFCKGLADQMRLRGHDDLADLLHHPAVMVARRYGYRETARVMAMKRDENACKMLEGHLVVKYADDRWREGASETDMRLVDKAVGSLILLTLVQCSLRISSLCRTESVTEQKKAAATRSLAPDGGVALDRNILWCTDVSFYVVCLGLLDKAVVMDGLELSLWWSAHPEAFPRVEWMGVAFRSSKCNADGKRANKFRVERDCQENCDYLDRILFMVGMAEYSRAQDPFFSRPVSEQVKRTLSRRSASMVDGWSNTKRGDHVHEGRIRHVYPGTLANLMAKEVAHLNGLDDTHVTTKSLKILAITTLEEARGELGLSQMQVASFCDHKSLGGNAAYKQLADKQSVLSLVAKAKKRAVSWGVAAVPELAAPVNKVTKKRKAASSGSTSSSSGTKRSRPTQSVAEPVVSTEREGKRTVVKPVRLTL